MWPSGMCKDLIQTCYELKAAFSINAETQRGCCRVVVPCQVCSTDFFTCEVVLSQKGPDFSSTDLEQTRDNSPCQVLFHARDPFSAAWQGTDMGVILGDRESKLIYS